MKWMGWSWDDYQSAPRDVVDEIIDVINKEWEEYERIRNGN